MPAPSVPYVAAGRGVLAGCAARDARLTVQWLCEGVKAADGLPPMAGLVLQAARLPRHASDVVSLNGAGDQACG